MTIQGIGPTQDCWAAAPAFAMTFVLLVLMQRVVEDLREGNQDEKKSLGERGRGFAGHTENNIDARVHNAENCIEARVPNAENCIEARARNAENCIETRVPNDEYKIETRVPKAENNMGKCDRFVPSDLLIQLFPMIDRDEAMRLLSNAGVAYPSRAVVNVDEATHIAVQNVVDDLVEIYFTENRTEEVMLECSCCIDQFQVEQFVSCRAGRHWYCVECVRRYAEALVFGSGRLCANNDTELFELACIAEECHSTYCQTELERALPQIVLERYGELQGSLTVAKASLKDMLSCPKCGFQASLWEGETVFRCPNEDCRHVSCVKCRRPDHLPLSCSESKDQQKDQCRLKMEEEMTNALLRKCPDPKCGKVIIKSDGCNKLKCPCGLLICNVCKQRITGYEHFCQTFNCQHDACGKCSLWSSTENDDELAVQEAFHRGQEEARGLGLEQELEAVEDEPKEKQRARRIRRFRIFRRRRAPVPV